VAAIHLEFDVDSDVHPELHAMLSSIGSALSQGERLRQLAATGLVWEKHRLQDRHDAPPSPAALAQASEVSAPAPSLSDPPAHREEIERVVENVGRELPVLFDVVHPDEAPRLVAVTGRPSANSAASATDIADGPSLVSAVPHKTLTRPRLQRMKEKGLFKNG
jgi:hypothetical protein